MAGFSQQGNGQYSTLSRSATFSRSMSLFFKVYINQFASDKKLSIIYAGGDDVLLLALGKILLPLLLNFVRTSLNGQMEN